MSTKGPELIILSSDDESKDEAKTPKKEMPKNMINSNNAGKVIKNPGTKLITSPKLSLKKRRIISDSEDEEINVEVITVAHDGSSSSLHNLCTNSSFSACQVSEGKDKEQFFKITSPKLSLKRRKIESGSEDEEMDVKARIVENGESSSSLRNLFTSTAFPECQDSEGKNKEKFHELLNKAKCLMKFSTKSQKDKIISNLMQSLSKSPQSYVKSKDFAVLLDTISAKIEQGVDIYICLSEIRTEFRKRKEQIKLMSLSDNEVNATHKNRNIFQENKISPKVSIADSLSENSLSYDNDANLLNSSCNNNSSENSRNEKILKFQSLDGQSDTQIVQNVTVEEDIHDDVSISSNFISKKHSTPLCFSECGKTATDSPSSVNIAVKDSVLSASSSSTIVHQKVSDTSVNAKEIEKLNFEPVPSTSFSTAHQNTSNTSLDIKENIGLNYEPMPSTSSTKDDELVSYFEKAESSVKEAYKKDEFLPDYHNVNEVSFPTGKGENSSDLSSKNVNEKPQYVSPNKKEIGEKILGILDTFYKSLKNSDLKIANDETLKSNFWSEVPNVLEKVLNSAVHKDKEDCKSGAEMSLRDEKIEMFVSDSKKEIESDIALENSLPPASFSAVASQKDSDTCLNIEENKELNNTSSNSKIQMQIKRLEQQLAVLDKKIKKMQEKDMGLNDLDSENSIYVKEDLYKKRFVKIYDTICKLKKIPSRTGRIVEKKFNYEGSRYPTINVAVSKFVNKRKPAEKFPNYADILNVVNQVNNVHGYDMNQVVLAEEARRIFQDVGKELKRRRVRDFEELFGCHLTDKCKPDEDPAEKDENLRNVLQNSSKTFTSSIQNVIDKYALKQTEVNEKCDEEEHVSPAEEQEEESNDLPSTAPASPADALPSTAPASPCGLPSTAPASPNEDSSVAVPEQTPLIKTKDSDSDVSTDTIESNAVDSKSVKLDYKNKNICSNVTLINNNLHVIDDVFEVVDDSSDELPDLADLIK